LLIAGIAAFDGTRRSRRNASPFVVRTYDEATLRQSRSNGIGQFLLQSGSFAPCAERASICYSMRGDLVSPSVEIDELPSDIDQLDSYRPEDLYSIEVFRCFSAVRIHAYTYAFIERMGRRPRAMFPACVG
jgi:hypothetical protein